MCHRGHDGATTKPDFCGGKTSNPGTTSRRTSPKCKSYLLVSVVAFIVGRSKMSSPWVDVTFGIELAGPFSPLRGVDDPTLMAMKRKCARGRGDQGRGRGEGRHEMARQLS